MRFDDEGLFYVPDVYRKKERTGPTEKPNRPLPPIPETGWVAREEFPDLRSARAISLDTETFDPDLRTKGPGPRRGGFIVGVSLAVEGWARYYPVAHSMGGNLDKAKVFAWLKEQLAGNSLKVGANLLYDLDFLAAEGIEVGGRFYDVQYADPLIYEYERSYSLDAIAARRLKKHKETDALYQWCSEAFGGPPTEEQRANIWRSPVELAGPYAESDASLPLEIMRAQVPMLRERDQIEIARMEFGLIPLLLQMRRRGVRIDLARCKEVDDALSAEIEQVSAALKVNVYAAEEIAALCRAEGIEFPRTAKGAPSFTKDWLKRHPHPKMREVTRLRTLYKMRDTFIRGSLLGTQINGRVHCSLHPMRSDEYGTVSGRFSSSDPNLQQIPARDPKWGPIIRSCFVPEEGEAWMKNDLSQIEFRLGVHYGVGDIEPIREQYRRDHKTSFYRVAAAMTGLEYNPAKALSLGSLYGMGLDKFAETAHLPLDEAKAIYYAFHRKLSFMRDTYNHYAQYVEQTRTENEDGWVRTIGGRLCHLQEGYEHKALNRKLQGSCADWVKRAMLEAHESGVTNALFLSLTVHDELDSSVPRSREGADAARELHSLLENAYTLCIPVLAGVDLGASWGTLEEYSPDDLEKYLLAPSDSLVTSH